MERLSGLLGCLLFLLVLIFGLAQFVLGYQGIEYELGTGWAIAAVAAALIFRFTLPITIGTYFGVVDVHGGPWWAGLLITAPGFLVAAPFMATAVLAFILDGVKKPWTSTGEPLQDITPPRPSVAPIFPHWLPAIFPALYFWQTQHDWRAALAAWLIFTVAYIVLGRAASRFGWASKSLTRGRWLLWVAEMLLVSIPSLESCDAKLHVCQRVFFVEHSYRY